jgi:NAD(P)H-dependent flavin oxidoreductase YrpB (nitropropane dioxygenase family)
MKMSAVIESLTAAELRAYGRACGWALARAHARSGDAAMIAGYLGSSQTFDDIISEFATEYADQVQLDYRTFLKAVRSGEVKASTEV